MLQIPSDDVEYVVSPVVTINGDGANAAAYCIVNNAVGSSYEITRVVPINVGINYTGANVIITAPTLYGAGANVAAVVSPIKGHGFDPVSELGGRYVGITMPFDTAVNENYKLPNYGSYRRAGLLYNPSYNDVFFTVGPTLRNNLTLTGIVGNFTDGEIVYQGFTGAAASVVSCNTSWVQIENINNTFNANAVVGNTQIIGLSSGAIANVATSNTIPFDVNGFQDQPIFDLNTNASGTLTQVIKTDSQIRMTDVVGKFNVGDTVYDPSSNSYAKITSIYNSNNAVRLDNTFGTKFNQTTRIPLTSNVGTFTVGERVSQEVTLGQGLVIDTTHELDLQYSSTTGTLSVGNQLNNTTTGGNGIVTFANNSYIRLTGVQGTFNPLDAISCITGTGQITSVYPVLVLSDVLSLFNVGAQYVITGANSGALGVDILPGTIVYPELTKNTGEILYVNNIQPFSLGLGTKEIFQIVVSF